MKPIGILTRREQVPSKLPTLGISNYYVEAIHKAGGRAVMLPYTANEQLIKAAVEDCSGLLCPGGSDVSPLLYGEEHLSLLQDVDSELDTFQMAALRHALALKLPVLGICRGHQLINVALGGSLYQDLSYLPLAPGAAPLKHSTPYFSGEAMHKVSLLEASRLARIYGPELWVNSYHHQGIKKIAPNLVATAKASDGLIEACELNSQYLLSVQWHPEVSLAFSDEMLALFEDFVKNAK